MSDILLPKILLQTDKSPPSDRYVKTITKFLGEGWQYLFFDDDAILKFFDSNPLEEFPDIKNKFLELKLGGHRADLFRSYYLYINGGIALESDTILLSKLEESIYDKEFVTVRAIDRRTIFPGLLASVPNHPIIYKALKIISQATPGMRDKNCAIFCDTLASIIDNENWAQDPKILICKERGHWTNDNNSFLTVDQRNKKILAHFPKTKIIPEELLEC